MLKRNSSIPSALGACCIFSSSEHKKPLSMSVDELQGELEMFLPKFGCMYTYWFTEATVTNEYKPVA